MKSKRSKKVLFVGILFIWSGAHLFYGISGFIYSRSMITVDSENVDKMALYFESAVEEFDLERRELEKREEEYHTSGNEIVVPDFRNEREKFRELSIRFLKLEKRLLIWRSGYWSIGILLSLCLMGLVSGRIKGRVKRFFVAFFLIGHILRSLLILGISLTIVFRVSQHFVELWPYSFRDPLMHSLFVFFISSEYLLSAIVSVVLVILVLRLWYFNERCYR